MTLLILDDVHKHFASHEVLNGASLQIDPGEKLGLVGPNGAGKTTLLRLIEGQDGTDGGTVTLRRGCRLGSVPQRPEFPPGVTVRTWVEGGLAEVLDAIAAHQRVSDELTRHHDDLASGAPAAPGGDGAESRLLAEQDALAHRIEALGGWHVDHRVAQVLAGVGLAAELWDREAATLSGGEKSRVALARALAGGHELLLLDEPTNHLDLQGIEWIEEYLRGLPGAVLVVSHDRRLLDRAVDGIVELEGGKLHRYPGGYTKYVRLREERYLAERRAWDEQQEYIRKEESFIRRYMGGQRTAEARGRRTRLASLQRLPEPRHDVRAPNLKLPKAGEGGELVLEADDLRGGYGERVLFDRVSLRVGKGERIGIVGRNGTGKSTLLRILAGRDKPLDGRVRAGHRAVCGYYDQESAGLLPDGTPLSEIRRDRPLMTDGQARSWLGRFLFRGDAAERPISALSGGERARLCLAKLVQGTPTWLALDEPTNHLDLPGRTALEEALSVFDGAMVFVSHDRAFLDGLATQIIEVGGEPAPGARSGSPQGARLFPGNYTVWRERRAAELADRQSSKRDELDRTRRTAARAAADTGGSAGGPAGGPAGGGSPATATGAGSSAGAAGDSRTAGRSASAGSATPPARRARNPWRFKQLEQRIFALEEEQKRLHADCAREEFFRDPARLKSASQRIAEIEDELATAYVEWESFVEPS